MSTTSLTTDFSTWKNKPFIGGYKSSKSEFYHSETQTGQIPRIMEKFHRDTQTVRVVDREGQCSKDVYTQSKVMGYCPDDRGDSIIIPKPYFDSNAWEFQRSNAAIKIQTLYRGYRTRCTYVKLLYQLDEKIKFDEQAIKTRQYQKIKFQKQERERRLHPKTPRDFMVLRKAIDNWYTTERSNLGPNPPRKGLVDLEKEYTLLIQTLSSPPPRTSLTFLTTASSPLTWQTLLGPILVDTPSTLFFRHLLILNHALAEAIPERLEVLKVLNYTIKTYDTPLVIELRSLITREVDLTTRGRDTEGVRARIGTLFRIFCQELIKPSSEKLYYCKGCETFKVIKSFEKSVRNLTIGKCRGCRQMKDVVMRRGEEGIGSILEQVRVDERELGHEVLLQEQDVRHLVDVIWTRKSIISGVSGTDDLILVRWRQDEQLTPWNCVLLTKSEAVCHREHPDGVYGEEFRKKVEQKLALGREYFKQLPKMIDYAKENKAEVSMQKVLS